jgi:GT2 family glycosyltransferase
VLNHRAPAARPALSVVVASNRSHALLDACLASLEEQSRAAGAEVIVARAGTRDDRALLERKWPGVRFVAAPLAAGIPALRGLGLQSSTGELVALTEDHCVAAPDWLDRMREACGPGTVAVGGGMGNAQVRRAIDWAAYYSDYGFYDASRPPGQDALLTAANVVYRRAVVDDVAANALAGEWENVVHDRLAARGLVLRFAPQALVRQNRTYGFREFMRDRFEHGRDYARYRLLLEPGRNRWLSALKCGPLPLVLTGRIARLAGRGDPRAFRRALPWLVCFLAAWSLGEAAGYVAGPARAGEVERSGTFPEKA